MCQHQRHVYPCSWFLFINITEAMSSLYLYGIKCYDVVYAQQAGKWWWLQKKNCFDLVVRCVNWSYYPSTGNFLFYNIITIAFTIQSTPCSDPTWHRSGQSGSSSHYAHRSTSCSLGSPGRALFLVKRAALIELPLRVTQSLAPSLPLGSTTPHRRVPRSSPVLPGRPANITKRRAFLTIVPWRRRRWRWAS